MSLSTRIDQELSQFILFGGLMDEASRRLTAEQVFQFLYYAAHPALNHLASSPLPKQYPNWYHLLERLLQKSDLRSLTANNEDFAFSVAREMLNWCKNTYQKFQAEHDYYQEEAELRHLKTYLQSSPDSQWITTLDKLPIWYPDHHLSWSFYRVTLEKQEDRSPGSESEDLPQDAVILRQNILYDWEQFLAAKKHILEEAFLEQTFSSYYQELQEKVQQLTELGDLISPFYNFLGQAWNDSLGNWNKIEWKKLREFAHNLERDHTLRELAEMLGRWQHARRVQEEHMIAAIYSQRRLETQSLWKV